jgi:hypothetical protein
LHVVLPKGAETESLPKGAETERKPPRTHYANKVFRLAIRFGSVLAQRGVW